MLLYSQPLYGDVGDVAFLVLFTAILNTKMIQCDHPPFCVLTLLNWPAVHFLSLVRVFCLFAGGFVCLVCFCFVCGFFASLRL